ncbi:MAG TPA: Gfo/Idh/MocA family oxidoreductase [Sedimentisphaerales bacterium]|nr:Gfo/Idh/MocA family oxidoreductase [Sedimentisphaerales bacterium]
MTKKERINRRQFFGHAAGAAAGAMSFPYIVSSSALGAAGTVAAGERITVGCVGVGPQGTGVMRNFLAQKDAQVVAVCDVKSQVLKARQDLVNKHYQGTGCAAYKDFRELLARDDIDVVLVATPDHWHVLVALAAVRAGKDVYLEKPMGLSLAQDQALRTAVHRHGRIFQFGTQQRSSRNFRFACELALNGRLGDLHTINVWSPGSSQGGDPTPVPVPEWLDYETWLGPAPYTPYTKDRCSNSLWWFISDYALGFIAGWGIHPIDIAFWGGGKKVTTPLTVEGKGQWPTEGVCDTAMNWSVVLKYDSGLTMNFTGDPFPEEWRQRYGRTTSHGTAFEGSEGWVHVDRSGINAHPKELLQTEFGAADVRLPDSNNHVRNLLDCTRTRARTIAHIDDAVQADILCHISDIAIRLAQKLQWDPQAERFVNNDAANRRLSRPMRSPWTL